MEKPSIAYRQGFEAAHSHLRYVNPFPLGCAQFNDFEQGFFAARKRGIRPLGAMALALFRARRRMHQPNEIQPGSRPNSNPVR